MADVMDLDMSLDEIAKKRAETRGNKQGRGRGAAAGGPGRVGSSLRHAPARVSPYVSQVFNPSGHAYIILTCSSLAAFVSRRL